MRPAATLSSYEVANRRRSTPQDRANLLKGKTWGDVPVIYKLGAVLDRRLWFHDHIPRFGERTDPGDPLR